VKDTQSALVLTSGCKESSGREKMMGFRLDLKRMPRLDFSATYCSPKYLKTRIRKAIFVPTGE